LLKPRGQFYRNGALRRRSECKDCRRPALARHAAARRGAGADRYIPKGVIGRLMALCQFRCGRCGVHLARTGFHIDHIVPVCKGGRHQEENLQLLCPRCNLTKAGS